MVALRQAQGTVPLIARFSDQMPPCRTLPANCSYRFRATRALVFELIGQALRLENRHCLAWVTA
jgi:hypothetical protein